MDRLAPLLLLTVALAGCAGSNDDVVPTFLNSELSDLSGTWDYEIQNAYDAIFTGCTGDAAMLEGRSFYEGLTVAPICVVPNSFEVVQDGDVLQVLPDSTYCGGITASVTGSGALSETSLNGSLQVASASGATTHTYSGARSGRTVEIAEERHAFSGAFQGQCDLTPPLRATVTVR